MKASTGLVTAWIAGIVYGYYLTRVPFWAVFPIGAFVGLLASLVGPSLRR